MELKHYNKDIKEISLVNYCIALVTDNSNKGMLDYQIAIYDTHNRDILSDIIKSYLSGILVSHFFYNPKSFPYDFWNRAITYYEGQLFQLAEKRESSADRA